MLEIIHWISAVQGVETVYPDVSIGCHLGRVHVVHVAYMGPNTLCVIFIFKHTKFKHPGSIRYLIQPRYLADFSLYLGEGASFKTKFCKLRFCLILPAVMGAGFLVMLRRVCMRACWQSISQKIFVITIFGCLANCL